MSDPKVDAPTPDAPTPASPASPASQDSPADWGMPAFAKGFPADPALDALVLAFARGDYRTVREEAPRLAAATSDAEVKRSAELLRERIEPDPTSRLLFVFAGLLLAFLAVWWVTHDGPEGDGVPPPAVHR